MKPCLTYQLANKKTDNQVLTLHKSTRMVFVDSGFVETFLLRKDCCLNEILTKNGVSSIQRVHQK